MKQFCTILLMLLLTEESGFPVYPQESPDRFARAEQDLDAAQLALLQVSPDRFAREEQDTVKINLAENRLIIENLPHDDILEIYNIMGVKVYSRHVKAGTNEYALSLPKGFYILKIGKITKKIALR